MPEVHFSVRWPDGTQQRCLSPSRTIEQALTAGAAYPVEEFVRRSVAALEAGSERVRELRGFACSAAAAQSDAIVARGAGQAGHVIVEEVQCAPVPKRFPAPERIDGHVPVVVVGGGQSGLSLSRVLGERGVEHLVLERDRVACSWREQRWDAFCLVTPNFQCRLPGFPYRGADPDGFMVKEEIIAYVDAFAASFDPPLYEGVAVRRVARDADETFALSTSHGELTADQVVLAVGGYHVPTLPPMAAGLPPHVTQVHSSRYRSPHALPDGAVLVVGSGQSGAQIAEDLHLAGRTVHLAVGAAPRVARFYRGRDVVAWMEDIGHYDLPIERHPEGLDARREANHYVTGRDGGRDIDLRQFATEGMRLHGRLEAVDAGRLHFAGDLEMRIDAADATSERIKDTIDRWIDGQGLDAPAEERYVPVWAPPYGDGAHVLGLEDEAITSVVWATGFRSDWSWVDVPAFDGSGYPAHHRGVTSVDGLHVLGLPWLHTWGSGRFAGIARDAEHLGEHVVAGLRERAPA
jgi:putative flavoprotein involved in K+ transport